MCTNPLIGNLVTEHIIGDNMDVQETMKVYMMVKDGTASVRQSSGMQGSWLPREQSN